MGRGDEIALSSGKLQQHPMIAEGIGFNPLQIQELGHTFVVGTQQLLEYFVINGSARDLYKTRAGKEPGFKSQHEYTLYTQI